MRFLPILAVVALTLAVPVLARLPPCFKRASGYAPEKILSPRPHEYLRAESLPENFWWGNVNGTNFLSSNVNQHIPIYCGSCWLHGSTSSFNDRLRILRRNRFPEIMVSRQVLLDGSMDCGSCDGGDDLCVQSVIASSGLPDETCNSYIADDRSDCVNGNCTCFTCQPDGSCGPVKTFQTYTATEYGSVFGLEQIKAEIFARGPVACTIDATDKFEAYQGGIFEEFVGIPMSNHVISLNGWGKDANGKTFLWGRNSWGSAWGENGAFRITTDPLLNLGVTQSCSWAVPKDPGF